MTRSEGDEGAAQVDQNLPDSRRLSNPSYQYVNNLDVQFVEYRRDSNAEVTQPILQRKCEENRPVDGAAQKSLFGDYVQTAGSTAAERTLSVEGGNRNGNMRVPERRCSDGTQNTYSDGVIPGMQFLQKSYFEVINIINQKKKRFIMQVFKKIYLVHFENFF